METKDISNKAVSDWQPITDKHQLAVLGKLCEEANELGSAISRCIIQGLDENTPDTYKTNKEWLQEEIADILALAQLAIIHLGLDEELIVERKTRKMIFKAAWFRNLQAQQDILEK